MKLEEIAIEITDEAMQYINTRMGQQSGVVISYNEVIN